MPISCSTGGGFDCVPNHLQSRLQRHQCISSAGRYVAAHSGTKHPNNANYYANVLRSLAPSCLATAICLLRTVVAPSLLTIAVLLRIASKMHRPLIHATGAEHVVSRRGWRSRAVCDRLRERVPHRRYKSVLIIRSKLQRRSQQASLPCRRQWLGQFTGLIHGRLPSPENSFRRTEKSLFGIAALFLMEMRYLGESGSGLFVITGNGPISAQHAVIALGPWSSLLLSQFGYRLSLFIKREYHRHYVSGQNPSGADARCSERSDACANAKRPSRQYRGGICVAKCAAHAPATRLC